MIAEHGDIGKQRRSVAVLEPGDGIGREAREHRNGVAVATSRGRDAGIASKAEPGEASVHLTAAVRRASVVGVVGAAVLVAAGAAGCAECASDADCALGDACVDGACDLAPQPRITLVAPVGPAADRFDLIVDVEFDGPGATLVVRRSPAAPGDACVPFLVREVPIIGNGGRTTTQVVVPALPALGGDFAFELALQVSGFEPALATAAFNAASPTTERGGAVIASPVAGDVDVDLAPFATFDATVVGPAVAWVGDDDGQPFGPRFVVASGPGAARGSIPLVRGPQVLWAETLTPTGPQRCGVALRGLPAGDDGGAVDVAVLATAAVPAWVALSLRIDQATATTVCERNGTRVVGGDDGANDGTAVVGCVVRRAADRPALILAEVLQVPPVDAVVDVAVVPTIAAGPVDALVRITQAGRPVALLGPFTLAGDDGNAWRAGRLLVLGGAITSVLPDDELTLGAPW
jgi:hypothetical protein